LVLAVAAGSAEVVYVVAVAQPGDYQLRVCFSGQPGRFATAEFLPMGGGTALKFFILSPAAEISWVFAGSTHLDPGVYAVQFLLFLGCTLSRVEIPSLRTIEPRAAGSQPPPPPRRVISRAQAIDLEHCRRGGAVEIAGTGGRRRRRCRERAKATGLDAMTLRAGRSGHAPSAFGCPSPPHS
jgi:hypothetical protein